MQKEAVKRNGSTAANIERIGLDYFKGEVEFHMEFPK